MQSNPAAIEEIPTDQLVHELERRGAMKINTEHRDLYQKGYRLLATEYTHKEVKAECVLVVPPYSLE